MTDFTNNSARMTDYSKRHRSSKGEYRFYFSLIVVFALPICTLLWAATALRSMALPEKGPIQMALCEAHNITPKIFWA